MTRRAGQTAPRHGYVYLLSNPSMPGLIKIGSTTRRPDDRKNELSRATGVPTPFRLEAWTWAKDVLKAERAVHAKLRKHRVNEGREFFRIDVEQALAVAKQVASEQRLRLVTRKGWLGGVAALAALFCYLNALLVMSGLFGNHPLLMRLAVFTALLLLAVPSAAWSRAVETTRARPWSIHATFLAAIAALVAVRP